MALARILSLLFLLLQNPDFGAKFLEDLKTLFGRLETSELNGAFQRAKAIRCSDLVGRSGEWKDVGFLNDNRTLAAWHYEDIESVKSDPARFVFSGMCATDQAALKLSTRYPIEESFEQYRKGAIPLAKVAVRDNPPVSVIFDRATNSYTFQLPYLYTVGPTRAETTYTLVPPTAASRPESGLTDEFRCKAINDADLTYRFLLCRTTLVNLNAANSKERTSDSPNSRAYYIFSDGREASSSVNLSFENAPPAPTTEKAERDVPVPTPVPVPAPVPARSADEAWVPVPPQSKLVDVGNNEFRLRFDLATWTGRIGKPQLIENRTVSAFTAGSAPTRPPGNCVWRPVSAIQAERLLNKLPDGETLFTLGFQKRSSSGISVSFDIDSSGNGPVGNLQCYLPQSQTPTDVTVGHWSSIVGSNIVIEARPNTSTR
jgi:hypothetical protein